MNEAEKAKLSNLKIKSLELRDGERLAVGQNNCRMKGDPACWIDNIVEMGQLSRFPVFVVYIRCDYFIEGEVKAWKKVPSNMCIVEYKY